MKDYVSTLEYEIALYSEEDLLKLYLEPTVGVFDITYETELGEREKWTWETGVVDVGVYKLKIITIDFNTLAPNTVYVVEKNVFQFLEDNLDDYTGIIPTGVEIITPKFFFNTKNEDNEKVLGFKYFKFLNLGS